MGVVHRVLMLQEARGTGSPGAQVIDHCEPPDVGAGLPEEEQVLLTVSLSLQPCKPCSLFCSRDREIKAVMRKINTTSN